LLLEEGNTRLERSGMKRFNWEEMRRYWESHNSRRATLDLDRDPAKLGNVLHPGAPLWLNEYYARHQKRAYENLFALLPPARLGSRALDIGCGAARWCKFLSERGYEVTGIDLQAELVALNRAMHPEIEFECVSVQEFGLEEPFDLISSVTVLQHNPFPEQDVMIHKLRAMTRPGGYVLALENVRDQAPHVFANSVRGWQARFRNAGFESVAVQRYDYNFLNRLYVALGRRATSARKPSKAIAESAPEEYMTRTPGARKTALLRHLDAGARRVAVAVDGVPEPLLIRSNLPLPTLHCGFLFKAVGL
jgi:2-polyprenyl-3-methyl-5-hydroxy-6-metoxy-1,4-benzoquinol methylase